MRITTRTDRCISTGQCVLAAPEVFDQDDEQGLVVVLAPEPTAAHQEAAREAAAMCPVSAIALTESGAE